MAAAHQDQDQLPLLQPHNLEYNELAQHNQALQARIMELEGNGSNKKAKTSSNARTQYGEPAKLLMQQTDRYVRAKMEQAERNLPHTFAMMQPADIARARRDDWPRKVMVIVTLNQLVHCYTKRCVHCALNGVLRVRCAYTQGRRRRTNRISFC